MILLFSHNNNVNLQILKIGVMLFKRLVFETRRKTKGGIRPKVRLVYKDIQNVRKSFSLYFLHKNQNKYSNLLLLASKLGHEQTLKSC